MSYEKLVEIVCQEYGINTDEYYSKFRYGNIGRARQVICYILRQTMRNIEVSKITGFSPARISNSVRIISRDRDALLKVNQINYGITEQRNQKVP